jgi:hypothetical protein
MITYPLDQIPFSRTGSFLIITSWNSSGSPRLLYKTCSGRVQMITSIAKRFCDLFVQQSGFWENHQALTGKGLPCPGYSWTAPVFLLLAEWLIVNSPRMED